MHSFKKHQKPKIQLTLLHGFLGQAADWQPLMRAFTKQGIEDRFEVHAYDLFSPTNPYDWSSWSAWVDSFLSIHDVSHHVVVGYSFGGRAALHLLRRQSDLCQAVVIGAHPGLTLPAEIMQRQLWEQTWAERFAKEDWPSLFDAWNQLEVFSQTSVIPRDQQKCNQQKFSRQALTGALQNLSPTQHAFSLEELYLAREKIVWVYGEQDDKYKILYQTLLKGFQVKAVAQAGHRVHWDQPETLASLLTALC